MVRLEELDALDLLLWLQSGFTAAAVAGTNQSTICRRARRVLSTFEARLQRGRDGWRVHTSLEALLDLQRQIHQQHRLQRRSGLRLNVPQWSRALLGRAPLQGWITNPSDGPLVCENPLELLRGHVIDACLVTPTQVRGEDLQDLELHEIYRSHIDAHLITAAAATDWPRSSPEQARQQADSGLVLLPFLPGSCRDACRERFEQLHQDAVSPFADLVAQLSPEAGRPLQLTFLTPLMARGLADLRPLSLPLEWPYRECLAVLRRNAREPAIQALVDQLQTNVPRALASLLPG